MPATREMPARDAGSAHDAGKQEHDAGTTAALPAWTVLVLSQSAHSMNTLTVGVTSGLDQDPGDESFGVDNVLVMVR
jgi:hypothetical protein